MNVQMHQGKQSLPLSALHRLKATADLKSTKVEAAEIKRPKTNLVPNSKYALPMDRMKTGFLGVFNWKYSGDPRKTMFKIAFAPLMNMTAMTIGKRPAARNPEERAQRKNYNSSVAKFEQRRDEQHLAQYTTLKKVNGADPHFILNLPVALVSSTESVEALLSLFGGPAMTDDARKEFEQTRVEQAESEMHHELFPANTALTKAGLNNDARIMFSQCLMGVRYQTFQSQTLISLQLKIAADEAESLVSTDWLEIRPVDLYPLFTMWVEAEYVSKFYGKSATSLSRIAATLPVHIKGDERVDQYGIGVTTAGDPIWLPKECNNTEKFESQYSAAGTRQGEFSLRTVSTRQDPNLPINIPILVDWVNFKFTYSSAKGKPVIMGLEHVRKCTPSMAMNMMRRPMKREYIKNLMFYAQTIGVPTQFSRYGHVGGQDSGRETMYDVEMRQMSIADYFEKVCLAEYEKQHNLEEGSFIPRYLDLFEGGAFAYTQIVAVLAFIKALQAAMIQSAEALYVKYAVATITDALGMLTILAHYGGDLGGTKAAADSANKAAINQGVDPNWTPPPLPLLTKKFTDDGGLIPHQFKVRNILRDSPDHALLPIDAGGGKSMLSITDVLYEIKAGRSAPYLIMCPAHLVANYVSEIVEFTDGLVNVIPITSYNFHTTGVARFEEILKAAPINTILVVDYACLKFRARATVYGTSSIFIYPVVEMLRQFKPGYVMCDESHFLRNANNSTSKSVMTLIADIPKKRMASGTMNPDSPSDLVGQVALLDPTIFGSRTEFNETYGARTSGGRVMEWRKSGPNSISTVLPRLKQCIVWAGAKRKEWACALPEREDRFLGVSLTPNQTRMYEAIFDDMVKQIRKDAEAGKKKAKKLLEQLEGKKASPKDEDDFGDLGDSTPGDDDDDVDSEDADVGTALQPYLADIERFVTDPAGHPYSRNGVILANGEHLPPLSGEDLISPKTAEVQRRLKDYLDTHDSKVLIFVNYNASAESIFNSMSPELQACGMLYKTANKTEMVNRFKKDPNVRWLIGIRKSLEVGLNLQVAGYLIRVEGVWTPGEQEQGDSRIARPYFGAGGDKRKALMFDTIVANHTIDITKAARLRAKIVAVAKFENTGNPNYEAIEDIPVIPMTLDTIQNMNDFGNELAKYQSSMAQLHEVMDTENKEEKARMEAAGGFKFTQVPPAPPPAGAALLSRVPYAQGTELYNANELGLVRVDNYLGMELADEVDDDDSGGEEEEELDENSARAQAIKEQRQLVMGQRCHTEVGDGYIIDARGARNAAFIFKLTIRLDDGSVIRNVRVTNGFIVTRTETNGLDMRLKVNQAAGLPTVGKIEVPAFNNIQRRMTKKEQIEQEKREQEKAKQERKKDAKKAKENPLSIGLKLSMLNGFMRVSYDVGQGEERAVKALEALGFKIDPSYYYTRVRTYKHLIKQATLWRNAGFNITSQVDNDTFEVLAEELAGNSMQTHRHYQKLISAGNFKNYLRTEWKANADPNLVNIFALITDGGDRDSGAVKDAARDGVDPRYGVAYLCLPAGAGHPGTKKAIQPGVKAPSSRWLQSPKTLSYFVGNLQHVHQLFQEILDSGIDINNKDELNKDAKSVKKVTPKDVMDLADDPSMARKGRK